MTSSTPLSEQQVQHFKTHGFLVLENLLDESSLNQWRQQIWRELEASLDQPDSWPRERAGLDGYQYDPPESALVHHPALTPYHTAVKWQCLCGQWWCSHHSLA